MSFLCIRSSCRTGSTTTEENWKKQKPTNLASVHDRPSSPPSPLEPSALESECDERSMNGAFCGVADSEALHKPAYDEDDRAWSLFGSLDSASSFGSHVLMDKMPLRRRLGAASVRLAPLSFPLPTAAITVFESIAESEEDTCSEDGQTTSCPAGNGTTVGTVLPSPSPSLLHTSSTVRSVHAIPVSLPFSQAMVEHGSLMSSNNPMYSPILIELFTAQGCSSCPRADRILSRLGKVPMYATAKPQQVAVIPLAFHVGYWDCLDWNDPFASMKWTMRQKKYAEKLSQRCVYTPQLVVQGQMHCVGSKADDVHNLLRWAPRYIAPEIKIESMKVKMSGIRVTLRAKILADVEGVRSLRVKVALYENGNMTAITGGENAEKTLWNDRVVRRLQRACSLSGTANGAFSKGSVHFKTWPDFKQQRCGIVVFLQDTSTMRVYGCQQFSLENR